ncbi:MAG: hypothetical protein MUC49_16735 [Raineya sp.]|jgi:hypothetical protein|nr:hypothetical protein [Raineya sp.]
MKNIFWTLVIWFSLQNYVSAQNLSESQSRSGETQNMEIPMIDTLNTSKKVDKINNVVILKSTQEKTTKKFQLLPKINNIKEGVRIKKYLKTNKVQSRPLKSQKRADAIDTLNTIGWISLGLAFFFLVRFPLQTLWLLVIGAGYLVLGSIILSLLVDRGSGAGFVYIILWLLFVGIPAFITMFIAIFSYLAIVWHATVIFNIIGFSLLGLSLISLLIANLL